eukprot:15458219-Alexandrium_andersonii.AAC.1
MGHQLGKRAKQRSDRAAERGDLGGHRGDRGAGLHGQRLAARQARSQARLGARHWAGIGILGLELGGRLLGDRE